MEVSREHLEQAKQNILEAQQKQKDNYVRKHAKPELLQVDQLALKKDFTRKKTKGALFEAVLYCQGSPRWYVQAC